LRPEEQDSETGEKAGAFSIEAEGEFEFETDRFAIAGAGLESPFTGSLKAERIYSRIGGV
jgi:hypothetical protein